MKILKSILILLISILVAKTVHSQEANNMDSVVVVREGDSLIFHVVEQMPRFPGGEEARIRYLNGNLNYPLTARENGIQGKVYVTFVIEADGSVSNVNVLRGIGGGCDEEAAQLISNMPTWEPGKQRGKPVRVQFNMPILFRIGGSNEYERTILTNYDRGIEEMSIELYEEAIESFSNSIVKKELNYKEAYCTRGICRYQLGYYELAVEDILEAQNIGAELDNNQIAVVMYLLANEFFIQSKLQKAIELYTHVIELNPKDAKAYYNRGLAYNQTGDADNAKNDWKKAKKLGFDVPKNVIK